ncbi:hypothetical protein EOG74_24450 [Salmonella enterica]|nr:hypothetical protein [Salmonella enterica]
MWVYSIVFGMFTIVASQLISTTETIKMTIDQYTVKKMYNGFNLIRNSVELLREQKQACLMQLEDNHSIPAVCINQGMVMSGYDFTVKNALYQENCQQTQNSSLARVSTLSREKSDGKIIITFYSGTWILNRLAYQFSEYRLHGIWGRFRNHKLYAMDNKEINAGESTRKILKSVNFSDDTFIYIF